MPAGQTRGIIRHRLRHARGIARIVSTDDTQQRCRVADVFCERANLVERRRKGDKAVARHAAIGWFQADAAAQRRRLADGAAGVRAERGNGFVRRHRRRRTAGRAAGNARGVPRIARNTEGGIFRRAAHGKFVHVQPAKNNRARRLQLFHDRRVVGRNELAEDFRAAIERLVFDGQNVLDRNRNSQQWLLRMVHATGNCLVSGIGLRQRVRRIVADKSVDFSVHARNLVEARLHGLARGNFALGEFRGEFGNGELI
jgi:hypothetical protein